MIFLQSVHSATRKIVDRIRRCPLLVLPLLWALFSLLLVALNAFPDRYVKQSIQRGIDETMAEGDHPWLFFTSQSQIDNFTDRIMLQQSQRTSLWNSVTAVFAKKNEWDDLSGSAVSNPLFAAFSNQGYPRYWHGYTVILKPLLAIFDYTAIRMISFIMLLFLICLAFSKVCKEFGLLISFCFLMTLSTVNIFVVPMSLVFSPVFYILLLTIVKIDLFKNVNNRFLLFLVIGCLTNYFDFLTIPLVTLCIPLVFVSLYDFFDYKLEYYKRFSNVAVCGLGWLLGYASTWGMKWVLSSLVLGKNVVEDAIRNILIRSDSGGINEAKGQSFDRIETIKNNYTYMFENYPKRFVALLIVFIVILQIWKLYFHKYDFKRNLINSFPVLMIAFAPIVWYIALSNHSTIHMEFYAYKNVSITIFCMLLYLILVLYPSSAKRES